MPFGYKSTGCNLCECLKFRWAHWKPEHTCECGCPADKHGKEKAK